MNWKEIRPEELNSNIFEMIGKDWMLITAEKEGKVNTMTASWGGVGVMWGKNVVGIVIRPQRYTREFVEEAATLSLTFLDESYREQLNYAGCHSGRDVDKIKEMGLTTAFEGKTPYFQEGKTVILARKLYAAPLDPEGFLDPAICEKMYPQKDFHILYVCEIEKVLCRQEVEA